MPKKTAETQQVATQALSIKVPKFEDFYREASKYSPNSKTTFEPFRFSIIRQGKSGAVLEHKSKGDITLPNPFQAVLLYTNNKLECRCTLAANTKTLICRSPNRRHSISGNLCSECPYKTKDANGNMVANPKYQIRTLKNYYLMPIVDNEMYFARFKTTVPNITKLLELSDNVTAHLKDFNIKDYPQAVVEVKIKKFQENNNDVYRPDSTDFEIVNVLEDGSWNDLKEFMDKLIKYEADRYESNTRYVAAKYAEVSAALPKAATPSAVAKPAAVVASADVEAPEAPDVVCEGEEDDLPF